MAPLPTVKRQKSVALCVEKGVKMKNVIKGDVLYEGKFLFPMKYRKEFLYFNGKELEQMKDIIERTKHDLYLVYL